MVADANVVRQLFPNGTTRILAGQTNFGGYAGDGGPATLARLTTPNAAVPDGLGGLWIAGKCQDVVAPVVAMVWTVVGR